MIIGVDEAGRGPWAGPMVVGAVALKKDIKGLNDSKILSIKKRVQLFQEIIELAEYGIGWVSAKEIDAYGLTQATQMGINRAINNFDKSKIVDIIIDGNINYLDTETWPMSRCLIRADALEPCVMAASIIAKESRDNYMQKLATKFPGYDFDKNKGYGTKNHRNGLIKNGICQEHRLSFKPIRELS